ncbi:MAG: hypothetical protein V4541_00735 [Bacteroidota bacterium]
MKGILSIIISLTLSVTVSAQVQPDSIYFYRQDSRVLDMAFSNATQLIHSPFQKTSSISFNFNSNNGHYRKSQEAENNSAVHFFTGGIQTLGSFKFSGSFDFERMWEDSLAYTMKGLHSDVSPFYYMAQKAGNYQRLNYRLKGTAVYALVPNKLNLSAGIDYLFNSASRAVDPRPSVDTYHIIIKPAIIYQWQNKAIGLGADFGYGTEINSIGYSNQSFATSNLYPDRFIYMVTGYGYSDRKTASIDRSFRRKTSYTGLNLNYAANYNSGYLKLNLRYNASHENNSNELDQSINDKNLGTFDLDRYAVDVLSAKNNGPLKHQFFIKATYTSGIDYNTLLGGSNYKYRQTTGEFGYNLMVNRRPLSLLPEFGLTLKYEQQFGRDISAGTLADHSYLQPGLSMAVYKTYKGMNRFSATLLPALRLPLSHKVNTTAGLFDYFTNGIVYPDHSYWSSTAAVLSGKFSYFTPVLFKGTNTALSISGTYLRPLNTQTDNIIANFVPSGYRLAGSASLNFYF